MARKMTRSAARAGGAAGTESPARARKQARGPAAPPAAPEPRVVAGPEPAPDPAPKDAARPNVPRHAAKGKRADKPARAPKARTPKRVSGLDLAAKVLADAGEPLNAKAIAQRAIAAGWQTSGRTPEATLYAAIIREIARKKKDARFVKRDRGLFASAKAI